MISGMSYELGRGTGPLRGVTVVEVAGIGSGLDLVERADVLVEGLRPGAAERLGIGPEQCHERNPVLVHGRFSRTAATLSLAPSVPGALTREALTAWGIEHVDAVVDSGAAV